MKKERLIVTEEEINNRLDIYLTEQYEGLSRNYIQKLIKEKYIKVNERLEKSNYIVKLDDIIEVGLPEVEQLSIKPENININIIYEDSDILIIDKEQGMIVHPTPSNYSGTLVNALLHYCGSNLSDINGEIRPGIVHRIDKDTSGLLVIAKNNNSHRALSKQFKEHTAIRKYNAIVCGNIKETSATIDAPIGRDPVNRLKRTVTDSGKQAITHFKVLKNFKQYTYIEAKLETGRTHQIRVHFSYIKRPILGDTLYGYKNSKFKLKGQVLHAKILGFIHPTKNEYVEFTSDLPQYFNKLLNVLEHN